MQQRVNSLSQMSELLLTPDLQNFDVHYMFQTTIQDGESGQVISAVNCYFMCQVKIAGMLHFCIQGFKKSHL